jgi:CheY-like chemotaxis protein
MRILYVEDEPNDAVLVARYIQSTLHQLILATNTQEARTALPQKPDLIMIDVVLGHSREGLGFVRELRKQGFDQPIIAVTGLSLPQELEECRQSGFDFILTKPFTVMQLESVIKQYQ